MDFLCKLLLGCFMAAYWLNESSRKERDQVRGSAKISVRARMYFRRAARLKGASSAAAELAKLRTRRGIVHLALVFQHRLYGKAALILFLGTAVFGFLLIGPATGQTSISVGHLATSGGPAHVISSLEQRKQPMRFSWAACQPNCGGWVGAVGIVTADTPNEFDEFARGRELFGTTIVLDSSGGSVNDAIALGRRWRNLGMLTTVGTSNDANEPTGVEPQSYCESICVFLLLSGRVRSVPHGAHVRVHQIWMGDRADDAKAATYSADDMRIVERDIGRLAKYTFDMGGGGDLLSLALSVPPWEELHELSPAELRQTNLVTTDEVADVLRRNDSAAAVDAKAGQEGFVSEAVSGERLPPAAKSTKTAKAGVPTDLAAAALTGREPAAE